MRKTGWATLSLVSLLAPMLTGCFPIRPIPKDCRTYIDVMDTVAIWIGENPENLSEDDLMFSAMRHLEQELPKPKFSSLSVLAGQYASAIESGNELATDRAAQAFLEGTVPHDAACR